MHNRSLWKDDLESPPCAGKVVNTGDTSGQQSCPLWEGHEKPLARPSSDRGNAIGSSKEPVRGVNSWRCSPWDAPRMRLPLSCSSVKLVAYAPPKPTIRLDPLHGATQ